MKLVEAVKKHALENYTKNGWDWIVETYTDEELAELIKDAKTEEEAIKIAGAACEQ